MSVEPSEIADLIESYVNDTHDKASRFDNSTPLDESGIWTLHRLAADIYALGFLAGSRAEDTRWRGVVRRERDAAKAAKETTL